MPHPIRRTFQRCQDRILRRADFNDLAFDLRAFGDFNLAADCHNISVHNGIFADSDVTHDRHHSVTDLPVCFRITRNGYHGIADFAARSGIAANGHDCVPHIGVGSCVTADGDDGVLHSAACF